MKKRLLFILIPTLFFMILPSCLLEPSSEEDPVVVTKNPKNLLFVSTSDYSFSNRVVFVEYDTPSDFGATSYTLEFSDSNSPYNFQTVTDSSSDPYTTSSPYSSAWDLALPNGNSEGYLRLLITGGEYDGQYSNIEYATQCYADINIGRGLNSSIENTGVVAPHVGYGLVAEFSLKDDENNPVSALMTYQWYRVNPNNFEDREIITGATGLSYTTTSDDINHLVMIVATGDSVEFNGGLAKSISDEPVTN